MNIQDDFSGIFFSKIRSYKLIFHTYFFSFLSKQILTFKKVQYGKKCTFINFSYFYRYPSSIIKIGNYCRFRSDKISNLIGINRKCIISTHSPNAIIHIGNNCGFSGVSIGAKEKITIGNDLLCGANVLITDFDWHNVDPRKRRNSCETASPVIIEDNVFIGFNSIICKGVTIGANSVIGAGSVVTKSIPPNVIAAGNPCKVIRKL